MVRHATIRGRSTLSGAAFLDDALARARAGEAAGFEALYRAYGGEVAGFVASWRVDDAEAVTNDAFVAAFAAVEGFDGDAAAFRAWVFRIARNRIIDADRRRRRRPQPADAAVPEGAADSAEAEALRVLSDARVEELLGALTDDQRDVISLRLVADLSLDDVAAILDKPVTAVKRLQARGLRRLERLISAEEVSP